MGQRIINAKEAFVDIALGMDEPTLMRKYNISVGELRSLYKQLGNVGLLRYLNAKEVFQDIRSGSSHRDIMEKYGLSEKGLQSLLQQMDSAGLLNQPPEQDSVPAKVIIPQEEIVKDIRGGKPRSELMQKYRLTERGIRWICVKLITSGAISWQEVCERLHLKHDQIVPEKPRRSKRYKLNFNVVAHDLKNGQGHGKVLDVSENGLRISGIKVMEAERKTLLIAGDEFGEHAGITLDAVCRWSRRGSQGRYVAGFEISDMSAGSMSEFLLLLKLARSEVFHRARRTGHQTSGSS